MRFFAYAQNDIKRKLPRLRVVGAAHEPPETMPANTTRRKIALLSKHLFPTSGDYPFRG